ncbi:MAG: FMN-binding protein [Bdellovibrionales bacterium]|nr:FMN-binding protein [Bdellovibrionales bacterium]
MIRSILFFVCFALPYVHAETVVSVKEYLKTSIGEFPKLTKETFELTPAQQKELKAIAEQATDTKFTFYFGKDDKGVLKKACTAVPQAGKEGPMTVGVCFTPAGLVDRVTILDYSEERGKPVKEEAFLSQFKGKKVSDSFQVGNGIDAVSGATHSSKSVSEAVRKSAYAFKNFVGKG